MLQEQLIVLRHEGERGRIALVCAQIVAFLPPAAYEFLKVGTGVDVLVIG